MNINKLSKLKNWIQSSPSREMGLVVMFDAVFCFLLFFFCAKYLATDTLTGVAHEQNIVWIKQASFALCLPVFLLGFVMFLVSLSFKKSN